MAFTGKIPHRTKTMCAKILALSPFYSPIIQPHFFFLLIGFSDPIFSHCSDCQQEDFWLLTARDLKFRIIVHGNGLSRDFRITQPVCIVLYKQLYFGQPQCLGSHSMCLISFC